MKEVEQKRYAGPFKDIPFDNFIQSPIGLVLKDGGRKTRLIFHLSYIFKDTGNRSVNEHILRDLCMVHYNDIDDAIKNSFICRNGKTKGVFYGRTDVQSAFRLAPLRRSSWRWLVMKAEHPVTGETWYFIDKCLPFGASIICAIFQEISDALKFIVERWTRIDRSITNYLDDFLFIAATLRLCNYLMKQFMEICSMVGIPLSQEKTVWGMPVITFLGFLLDGVRFIITIPEEKCLKALNAIQRMISKKKATVRELQQLAGLLNFLNCAIFTRRVFTRRMYAKYANITDGSTALKQYHHVKLDTEFKDDCWVWLQFLEPEMLNIVNRPYVDISRHIAAELIEF